MQPMLETQALLARAIRRDFPGRIALVSSFGAESAVLLHLVAQVDRATPVILIDTGKLFGETLAFRQHLAAELGLSDVRHASPRPEALAQGDPDGRLYARDADACCRLRKVEPLARALGPFAAWISGRRRAHGGERAALPLVETDGERRTRLNPLAFWEDHHMADYARAFDLPEHPLLAQGYRSIGCAPCTRPVGPGEEARAGRWAGSDKRECGIFWSPEGPRRVAA
ncbi:MAG: phosphoadenylyl-sulfate reductase [Sphingomonadaceae bacterium]